MSGESQRRRVSLQPAHILHRRPYRESSLLLEAFTPEWGRMGLVARGARMGRRGSSRAALLQPFRPLLLSWSGRGSLATATEMEADGLPWRLTGRGLLSGFYLNELLLNFLEREDPHPVLYAAYREALAGLQSADSAEAVLRVFEKRLLQEIGYGLILDHDADSGAPVAVDHLYRYAPDHGPRPAAAGVPGVLVHGRTLLDLDREALTAPQSLAEAKRLMRAVLDVRLGGRRLKSRDLFGAGGSEPSRS